MVKHAKQSRGKNQRRGFQAIPFTAQLALDTLGDGVVLSGSILSGNMGRDAYIISVDAYWSMRANTTTENPITVGFAHSDLAVGEIAQALTAEPLDPDDVIAQEQSRRPVRKAGRFAGDGVNQNLNDGVKIRTPIKFGVGTGHQLNFWAENQSGASLTTGTIIEIEGVLYLRWR